MSKIIHNADLAIVVGFGAGSLIDQRLPNFLRAKVVELDPTPHTLAGDLLYPELSVRLLDALHRVHFELGPGIYVWQTRYSWQPLPSRQRIGARHFRGSDQVPGT